MYAEMKVGEKNSATIEDYLETLYILQRDGVPIVGARLAEYLKVTPPTVTNTLKRMHRDGLVASDEQGFHLSEQGFEMARTVMRRHMLTEWLLITILKVPWSQTHSEAHNLEHTVSEMIEEQMRTNLGNPKTCPHGNPMPGFESFTSNWPPLPEIAAGETVIIRRVHELGENDPGLMKFLEENGILPGAEVEISEILPFNQTISLNLNGRLVSLGFSSAKFIYVEKKV
jgi:DtxR family transcriptional regulator, Mn-dependent transcriptional regulator